MRSGEEGWNRILPWETGVKGRNSVEGNWVSNHEELGHQDENNWEVTQVEAVTTLQASFCYSSPGNFTERQRKWADLYVKFTTHWKAACDSVVSFSLSFLKRTCVCIWQRKDRAENGISDNKIPRIFRSSIPVLLSWNLKKKFYYFWFKKLFIKCEFFFSTTIHLSTCFYNFEMHYFWCSQVWWWHHMCEMTCVTSATALES